MTRTALYRFHDADGGLLYVGITNDPDHRRGQHARDAADTWYPLAVTREVVWFDTRAEAETAEREALANERPRFNVAHTSHMTDDAWSAHESRKAKRAVKSVQIDPRDPGKTADAIQAALTDQRLLALSLALQKRAERVKLPPVSFKDRSH
ncbi:GIY-YIG nuclease family protein [Streptomyces lavendulocolor]|uniref:GIY-YIG nuclease family protein n=1 Tax=Streptomyces lavendulocolor TaxID=67316 RepID=UPI0033C7E1EF